MKHLSYYSYSKKTIFALALFRIKSRRSHWLRRMNTWCVFPISIVIVLAFLSSVDAATPESAGSSSSAPIWPALVTAIATMIGLIMSLIYNGSMARKLQNTTAMAEQKHRQRELALKIVDTIATDRTAARRFAIGLVKVERVGYTEEQQQSDVRGMVYFIPVNSRFTVGRDSANDIVLYDKNLKTGDMDHNRELSRFQCGFVADQHNVVVEDFASANGTLVSDSNGEESMNINGSEVKFAAVRSRQLTDGDRILVAPFVLRFVKLQENKILLQ
jgi:hypothetical protein